SFSVDDSWNDVVTVQSEHAKMSVDTEKRVLKGEATYNISNPSGEEQDIAFSIMPGIELKEVYENDVRIDFSKNEKDNFMDAVYHIKLDSAKKAMVRIVYEGTPKSSQDSQMRQWGITDQFVLLPSTYPMPSCEGGYQMDCTLNLPKNLTPIMQDTSMNEVASEMEGCRTYQYKDVGTNWLIAGEYKIQKIEAGGQEIQFIYLKGREQVMKDSNSAAIVADVVNFFTEKFGPLDFQGKPFIIAELDASFVDGGWGLGNMSVFGEAMFAGNAYRGSTETENAEGGSGIGVAVHEIAHQWWGWSPDSVYVTEDGASPWSSEGLTVYSTYLYMKERYGEEYARKEFTDVWEKNTRKMQNAFYLTHLKYANKLPISDAEEIYTAFATTTRYDMMPYMLLKAEQLVGGEDAFLSSLKEISQKYRQKELTYEDFLRELGIEKEELQID
ncbi:MAG TPA: M1 family aminopeptidase, partial [Lachnospiraceae bacterium]|nr:M1 family aminopeptidase [Lachnospiraceae bacterium]